MNDNLSSLFKGNNSKWSMMRVLSFIVSIALIPAVYLHPDQATPICALIGGAIAGKWLQKKGEPDA